MAPPYIMLTGPLFIGSLLSYFFSGVFFIQLFVYFTEFARNDRKFFVGLVLAISVAEILHLIMTTHTAYTIIAQGFGDLSALASSPWSGSALPFLNGFVSFCVQLFFAWRVKQLGKNIYAISCAAIILLLALMQLSASLAVTIQFIRLGLDIDLVKTLNRTVIVWLSGTVACDVLMTGSIIIVLIFYKRSTTYRKSKTMIDTFIAHTIENGALTTVFAALNLVFFLVYPDNYMYICLEFMLGRLYANVLMSTLNRRDRSSVTGTAPEMTDKSTTGQAMPLTNLRTLRNSTNITNHGRPGVNVVSSNLYPIVSITTEVHVDDDESSSQKHGHGEKF
ncbi:hypothetical protein DFP72DRAFT_451938 [Ephemerocybe angulata]|uniref:DUF6534 domain-containing protein n=1 Tax=Ephemerocybe angulata TaxID=980116 RepID=A0A8H6HU08_9AGAR|nr:hypothetical protein DFP72DRAFT_451938 [Tulosesus angulatus]